VADAYDNALMETVIGLFKTECIRTTCSTPGHTDTSAMSVGHRRMGRLVEQPALAQ